MVSERSSRVLAACFGILALCAEPVLANDTWQRLTVSDISASGEINLENGESIRLPVASDISSCWVQEVNLLRRALRQAALDTLKQDVGVVYHSDNHPDMAFASVGATLEDVIELGIALGVFVRDVARDAGGRYAAASLFAEREGRGVHGIACPPPPPPSHESFTQSVQGGGGGAATSAAEKRLTAAAFYALLPDNTKRVFDAAAKRAGLTATAFASIFMGESGRALLKGATHLVIANSRSSARGVGQFVDRTWLMLASAAGTTVNRRARSLGYVRSDDEGNEQVIARQSVLDLRKDVALSINAVADYAAMNLGALESKAPDVARVGEQERGRIAHLLHFAGFGDGESLIRSGSVRGGEARAKWLLEKQIGSQRAEQRINQHGSAQAAFASFASGYTRAAFHTNK